tara:strand:- start:9463 stop:10800 length:1338 start_codon:yes stop_codon:yes gene_type:complete
MKRENSNLYKSEIHKLIPGGAHTYSKGDDQFSENAPAAISYGKGSYIWDVDGNKFLDCSMGLSSVSLGHAHKPVIDAVKKEIDLGVNFQRPSYIEHEMAKVFLSLIPKHGMIKFTKNGSTATTAAVKLARAKTGRKLIAFPSDHPFFSYDDWFIGKTECNKGVPDEITKLSITFKSCNLNSLRNLFELYPNEIAGVIMEPERITCSNCQCEISVENYLKQAIEITQSNGALFILDEMVTGFKIDLPGAITKYNLKPDLATWGKGIANGFSFCALTGKTEIMELGGIKNKGKEKVFLTSTTHGGETHSIRAAIKTIQIFKKKDVVNHNHKIGESVINETNKIIKKHKIEKSIGVIPCKWIVAFTFKNLMEEDCLIHRTYFMQEMIKQNILFQGVFIPCYDHKKEEVDFFINGFQKAIKVYSEAFNKDMILKKLIGEVTKPVFRKIL